MNTKKRNVTTFTLLLSMVLLFIGIIVRQLLLSLFKAIGLPIPNDSVLGNILLELIFFLVPYFIVLLHNRSRVLAGLGLDFSEHYWLSKTCLGGILGLTGIILLYFVLFIMRFISYTDIGFHLYDSVALIFYILGFFVRALFAGICEETFFRGLLQNYLEKIYNSKVALIAASIIFSLFHCSRYDDPFQLACVFLTGLTLGVLFMKTKSLYLSIGLHIATDFFIMLAAPQGQLGLIVYKISSSYTENSLARIIFALLSIFYLAILIIFPILYRKSHK